MRAHMCVSHASRAPAIYVYLCSCSCDWSQAQRKYLVAAGGTSLPPCRLSLLPTWLVAHAKAVLPTRSAVGAMALAGLVLLLEVGLPHLHGPMAGARTDA